MVEWKHLREGVSSARRVGKVRNDFLVKIIPECL